LGRYFPFWESRSRDTHEVRGGRGPVVLRRSTSRRAVSLPPMLSVRLARAFLLGQCFIEVGVGAQEIDVIEGAGKCAFSLASRTCRVARTAET
jgi:hypothetical protein